MFEVILNFYSKIVQFYYHQKFEAPQLILAYLKVLFYNLGLKDQVPDFLQIQFFHRSHSQKP